MSTDTTLYADPQTVEFLSQHWPPQLFQRESAIFYSLQVPNVSILLLTGQAEIIKENQSTVVTPPAYFGVSEMLQGTPSNITLIVKKDSTACIFDRQSLEEKIKNNKEIRQIFCKK